MTLATNTGTHTGAHWVQSGCTEGWAQIRSWGYGGAASTHKSNNKTLTQNCEWTRKPAAVGRLIFMNCKHAYASLN